MRQYLISLWIILLGAGPLHAQDSVRTSLTQLPKNYLQQVSSKADKYYTSITSKTEKTLTKLSRWEGKVKTILEKASPETAQRLFGNDQLTFAGLLQKYKEGKAAADNYKGKYDEYRDKLVTSVKFIEDKRQLLDSHVIKPLSNANFSAKKLNEQLKNTEAVQDFIKERKRLLLEQVTQHIGNSKYLKKINKEAYYYIATLKNYKEVFNDSKKTEELALKLLQKIPAFSEFMKTNSMFASMFGVSPGGGGSSSNQANMSGLQARAQLNNLLQQQFAAGGPNVQQQLSQNLQSAQSQAQQLTDKLNQFGGGGDEIPDFKVNNQKAKPFLKRLELGTNLQTQRASSYFPTTSDIGMSISYKVNDKSVVGFGASYKLGLGNGWRSIRITNEGIGFRSFVDWRLKGNLYLSGGYEQNYRTAFNNIEQLKDLSAWQQSGLIGVSKRVNVSKKKKITVQVLFDFLSYKNIPLTQPVLFRTGWGF